MTSILPPGFLAFSAPVRSRLVQEQAGAAASGRAFFGRPLSAGKGAARPGGMC